MKILMLASLSKTKYGNIYGGAEKSIINLANWLAAKEYSIILASVEGDAMPYCIDKRVVYEFSSISSHNKIGKHIEIANNTINYLKKHRPDMVISFWIHPLFYGLFFMQIHHIPFYYSERNDPKRLYSMQTKCMRYFVMKKANGIVFQTNNAKEYFNRSIQKKSITIHNPTYIKYDQYPFVEQTDNRIVAVGRLNKQKNYPLLIKAFSIIAPKYTNLVLEIYGEGPMKNQLELLISEYQLETRIKIMGTYENILDRIYGAKLFVMSSDYEGMPNALIEAMCLGITCVCSDCPCGGPRELIKDEENGFLFKTGDLNNLVFVLEKALSKDNSYLRLSAKNICKTHEENIIFRAWENYLSGAKDTKF